jgi:hypothetical protein
MLTEQRSGVKKMSITSEEMLRAAEQYHRDGFCITPPILPTDLIQRVSYSRRGDMGGGARHSAGRSGELSSSAEAARQWPELVECTAAQFRRSLGNGKSRPVPGSTEYYVSHLDDPLFAPVIYRSR